MILFDACAVRAIVTAVTLLVGLSTPPIIIDQTTKLLSSEPELLISHSDLPSLENDISLTLEWILLRPDRRQCANVIENHSVATKFTESLAVESVFVDSLLNLSDHEVNCSFAECISGEHSYPVYSEEQSWADNETPCPLKWTSSTVEQCESEMLIEAPIELLHLPYPVPFDRVSVTVSPIVDFVNRSFEMDSRMATPPSKFITSTEPLLRFEIDLLSNITQVSIHTLPGPTTFCDTEFFHNTAPQPKLYSGFKQHLLNANISQTPDSSYLASLRQLRLYIRELILHSLPTHWANWITHNRLTVGVVCVSVMCGSLLCPVLFYLWTVIMANEYLSKDLEILNELKLYAESELLAVATEMNKLMETNRVYRKELKDAKTQLRQSQLLGIEITDEVTVIAKELYSEKCDARRNMERIKSEHAKVLAEMNGKLEGVKRQVSWYQLAECKAKMELASLKKELEEERMERNSQRQSTSQLMTELQQELLTTKCTLKGNLETTQQKLRLAAEKAIELKLRLADSVMNDSELISKDSGIFEAWSH